MSGRHLYGLAEGEATRAACDAADGACAARGRAVILGVAVPTEVQQAPSADELRPIRAVRSVALLSEDFYAYHRHLIAGDVIHACVITPETIGDDPGQWEANTRELLSHVFAHYYAIGNEMDAGYLTEHSHASTRMDPPEYGVFWGAVVPVIRELQPSANVATGGFVSGSVDVLMDYERFCRAAEVVNLHPWNKTAAEAAQLIEDCRRALGGGQVRGRDLRWMIGEWNRPAAEIPGYVQMLRKQQIEVACFFSFHTFDVPGLTDRLGRKTDLYDALMRAITQPEPEVAMTVIEERASQIGAEKLGGSSPETMGQPLTGIFDFGNGVRMQAYYNCILIEMLTPNGPEVWTAAEAGVANVFLA